MILKAATLLALLSSAACVQAECPERLEVDLETATKLSFEGFQPKVNRFTDGSEGNKVVLKGFAKTPMVEFVDGVLTVSAGDPCEEGDDGVTDTQGEEDSSSVAMDSLFGLTVALGLGAAGLPATAVAGMTTLGGIVMNAVPSAAQATTISECELAPIEVDIFVASTSDEIVMREFQSGDFEVCPPETFYWKHHPDVFNGYEGCVGETGLYPCAQDSQGRLDDEGKLAAMYPLKWDGEACVETGFTPETRTYWILWGDPLDKHELNKRTGLNPVVSFPFNRGPYPDYQRGVNLDSVESDDAADARAMAKDFLSYLGAFTDDELSSWDVTMSEGAESGMVGLWAAKALEIARTTCNRDIYVLQEVPGYSYDRETAADIANKDAESFYDGEECLCANTTSCNDPTVTIHVRGWLPRTPLPVEMGGDGLMYAADSSAEASPWFESMVFPENPTGKIKTPQLEDPNRRVCDGVYVWPMYFGMTDFKIPMDRRPDCSGWSFSITKAYSASVRAGFVLYKEDPVSYHDAVVFSMGRMHTMANGLYSEWGWHGQMQLWELMMSRPMDDPTSWIGAYSSIMKEKWDLVIDGFADCPVLELTNPYAGAYAFFQYKAPYLAIQDGFISSFFMDVLGIRTTTYNFGFRGAPDESIVSFYGEGYTQYDFTRLQLYRDVSIYEEVARRAKIVCADLDATIGDFMSINQWAESGEAEGRRLEPYLDIEAHKRHLSEVMPDLTHRQLDVVTQNHADRSEIDERVANCAPNYSMGCLFENVGTRFHDF